MVYYVDVSQFFHKLSGFFREKIALHSRTQDSADFCMKKTVENASVFSSVNFSSSFLFWLFKYPLKQRLNTFSDDINGT